MDDLLKKYGGLPNLRKHLKLFHEKVCEEKGVKHYFFGIQPDLLIADQVNFRSLLMRKLDHFYRETPPQTQRLVGEGQLDAGDGVQLARALVQHQLRV